MRRWWEVCWGIALTPKLTYLYGTSDWDTYSAYGKLYFLSLPPELVGLYALRTLRGGGWSRSVQAMFRKGLSRRTITGEGSRIKAPVHPGAKDGLSKVYVQAVWGTRTTSPRYLGWMVPWLRWGLRRPQGIVTRARERIGEAPKTWSGGVEEAHPRPRSSTGPDS